MLFATLLLLADEASHSGGDHSHDHVDHGHHAEHLATDTILNIAEPAGYMYPVIASVVVFLLVFGILATVVWPKILGGLEDRQQKIKMQAAFQQVLTRALFLVDLPVILPDWFCSTAD